MSKFYRYKTLLINLVFGLFISVFVANAVLYFYSNFDTIVIELKDIEDSEKEENKTEKDEQDKIQILTSKVNQWTGSCPSKTFVLINYTSIPKAEIPTPPPESFRVLI